MRITRKEILKAIRTEKLQGGSFIEARRISNFYGRNEYVYDSKCKVCAVGAILRQKGISDDKIQDTAYIATFLSDVDDNGDLEVALEVKDYMGALSIKFERLYLSYGGGKRTKEKLAQFVKTNFPKEIRIKGV